MRPLTKDKYLSDLEYASLIENTKSYTRDSTLIRLALETGARASEVLALKSSDLDHSDKTLYIKALKGSNDRYFPISDDLYNRLVNLSVPEGERYFPITYSRLVQVWHWYRPSRKSFHSLRHTFAVHMYRRYKDLKFIQVCLGHRSPTTTAVYLNFFYTKDEMNSRIRSKEVV